MTNKKKSSAERIDEMFGKIPYEEPKTNPKKKDNEVAGQDETESMDSAVQGLEPEPAESEAQVSGSNIQEDENIIVADNKPSVEIPEEEKEVSPEDLFEEVRHSLMEIEEAREAEKPKWWQRFRKGSRKQKELEPTAPPEVRTEPKTPEVQVDVKEEEQEEFSEQIDELIEMLDTESGEKSTEIAVVAAHADETQQEIKEEKVIDFAEMKKRAFHAMTSEEKEKSLSEVRSVALEGGEEVFVEVEAPAEDQSKERWKAFENALLPYRRYITFAAIFIGFLTIVILGLLVFDAYQKSLPPPTVAPGDTLPYPTVLYMPGGVNFNLGRGSLRDGQWNPSGPEWLEGTEVCRWVAIPYSRQLEAVVRTLTREDKIELLMSNGDHISYNVYSITQMTLEDMLKLDAQSPCLLLVLADAKSDKRWVVTANP